MRDITVTAEDGARVSLLWFGTVFYRLAMLLTAVTRLAMLPPLLASGRA